MTESVKDDITVRIVYEGRAAKVMLKNEKLNEIEEYYRQVAEEGANEYQIEESKNVLKKEFENLANKIYITSYKTHSP